MANESIKIRELVNRAVTHSWSIPEFQRGFVWKAVQVRDLAESLWLGYPIGSLLIWNSRDVAEGRGPADSSKPTLWVVDGQQRVAAMCVLFNRRPFWWDSASAWEKLVKKYDIRFDVNAKESPYFRIADAVIRRATNDRYIPLSKLLNIDTEQKQGQEALQNLAKEVKLQGMCDGMDAMEVYTRLDRIRKIRDRDVMTATIDHELEDVVEIFARLNSRGTRVTEADIYLGIVAAKNKGWVKNTFLPYLTDVLKPAGFDLNPNLLFRTMTAIGAKKVRFKQIEESFWEEQTIHPAWERTKKAWANVISRFREYGILSNNPMPTEAALVTLVALIDKSPTEPFSQALYWFLQASRFGRYSGSSATSLEEDLRDISDTGSQRVAIDNLLKRFVLSHTQPLTEEDFLRDYGDARFGRFLLYLLAYRNKAMDWDANTAVRLGFEGLEVLSDFRPQWHHIFPRKYLTGKVSDDKIEALANIAVIGPAINIRINAKAPMDYFDKYKITDEKLGQQFINTGIKTLGVQNYDAWLTQRAQRLAHEGNAFLNQLREGLT